MKKLVLLMFLFVGTTLLANTNTSDQLNDEESYGCRSSAYAAANASGYAYASEDWQWIYYAEYHMCEMQ